MGCESSIVMSGDEVQHVEPYKVQASVLCQRPSGPRTYLSATCGADLVVVVGDVEDAAMLLWDVVGVMLRTQMLIWSINGHRKDRGGVGSGSGLPSTVRELAAIVARIDKTDDEGQAMAAGERLRC